METVDKKENTLSFLGREERRGCVCVCVLGRGVCAGVPARLSHCSPSDSGSRNGRTPLTHPSAGRLPLPDAGSLNLEQAAVLGTCSDVLSRWQQRLAPVSLLTVMAQKMTPYSFFFFIPGASLVAANFPSLVLRLQANIVNTHHSFCYNRQCQFL